MRQQVTPSPLRTRQHALSSRVLVLFFAWVLFQLPAEAGVFKGLARIVTAPLAAVVYQTANYMIVAVLYREPNLRLQAYLWDEYESNYPPRQKNASLLVLDRELLE
jgi:hypothetical protein